MEYDQEALEYIHDLEIKVFEKDHEIEIAQLHHRELARENTILKERLDEYLGVH